MCVLKAPTIENDLGWPIRPIIAIGIWKKEQFRCLPHPNAAVPNLQPRDHVEPFGKNGYAVSFYVTVCVFKNENSVSAFSWATLVGVGIVFCYPDPTALINRHGHRLSHERFGSHNITAKTNRERHGCRCLCGCHFRSRLIGVGSRRTPHHSPEVDCTTSHGLPLLGKVMCSLRIKSSGSHAL